MAPAVQTVHSRPNRPPIQFKSMRTTDVIVIGGGLTGLSVALHLRWRGLSVRVLERDRIGDGTSSRSSGWISAHLRTPNHLLELVLESLAYYPAFLDRLGSTCEFAVSGSLVAFDSEEQLAQRRILDQDMRAVAAYSGAEFVDAKGAHALEPGLGDHIVGGAYFAGDAQIDPRLLLERMLASARSSGVAVHEGAGVTATTRDGSGWRVESPLGTFHAQTLVNAAGAWAPAIAELAGIDLPVLPVSGQLLVSVPSPVISHCLIYQPDARFATGLACGLRPAMDGRLWMGTTYRAGTFDCAITAEDTASILDAVGSLIPTLKGVEIEQAWAGVRPVPADLIPIFGPVSAVPGYHVAIPIAGLAEAAGAGRLMAGVISGDERRPDLGPDRFTAAD